MLEGRTMELKDKAGWLEMKTMLGWSPRWCELRSKHGQFIRSHDKDDRTTRRLSDVRASSVSLEKGHSTDRYLEIAYARSPEAGVHTLRLRATSAAEAAEWMRAIQAVKHRHLQNQPGSNVVFTVCKDPSGTVGLYLKRASIDHIEKGSPADRAGLKEGMIIRRVCDTVIKLNDERKAARASIAAAPQTFEIEVCVPRTLAVNGNHLGASTVCSSGERSTIPRQVVLLALVQYRRSPARSACYELSQTLLQEVAAFCNEACRIMVVLWGWGSTVESRHLALPSPHVTAAHVHRMLSADDNWLSARCDDSSWDTKAVYFTGPSAGPASGRQNRIIPDEALSTHLGWKGPSQGLALHLVSVASKAHLEAFVSSSDSPTSPQLSASSSPRRQRTAAAADFVSAPADPAAAVAATVSAADVLSAAETADSALAGDSVPMETHKAIVAEKDDEIARLRERLHMLKAQLEDLRLQTGAVPWDEEEPSIVAELRDKVRNAATLDELESVDFDVEDVGFFTPVGTPHDSDHWGGVGSVTGRVSPLPCQFDDCASVCSWVGPSEGPRLGRGSVVSFMTRGNINEMPAMSASDGWSEGWHLRNQGYKKTGEKIPSLEALYTCVSVDLVRSANPLTNVAKSVKLPQVDFDTHGLPPCFVFNLQFPFCEAPSVWGNSGGPTVNAVVTFTLKEMTAEELDKIPAAKLVKELYAAVSESGSNGTDSALLGRFKMLVRAEKGVPKMFSRYNGKPVLVTRSGKLYKSEHYLEVDCNLRSWAVAARTALYSLWGAMSQYRIHVGFCIEGRTDSELPERLLGCCQMSNINLEEAPQWDAIRRDAA